MADTKSTTASPTTAVKPAVKPIKPATSKAVTKKPVAKTPAVKKPVAKKPVISKAVAAKPAGPKATASKVMTKPTIAKPITAKPVSKLTPKTTEKKLEKKTDKKTKSDKVKMERDSFTMPKDEYAQIAVLKTRLSKLGQPAKKSELLRAGIKLLAAMSDNTLKMTLAKIPVIKTGRPNKKS
jgi:hypothetical protein